MRLLLNFVVQHWIEIVIGAVLAVLSAVLADFVQPASRIRSAVRHAKNMLASQSVALLRSRITETERYRNRVAAYLASDKAHYLATLQAVLFMLLAMCFGATLFLINRLMSIPPGRWELLVLAPITMAIGVGWSGLRMASWDTRPKMSDVIAKLDREIDGLKAKLKALTK